MKNLFLEGFVCWRHELCTIGIWSTLAQLTAFLPFTVANLRFQLSCSTLNCTIKGKHIELLDSYWLKSEQEVILDSLISSLVQLGNIQFVHLHVCMTLYNVFHLDLFSVSGAVFNDTQDCLVTRLVIQVCSLTKWKLRNRFFQKTATV